VVTGKQSPEACSALQSFLFETDRVLDAPLLDEPGYIEGVLAFASASEPGELHALQTSLVSGLRLEGEVYVPALQEHMNPQLMELRGRLEQQLEVIRADGKRARVELADQVRDAGGRIAIRPTYLMTAKGVQIYYRHFPLDLEAAIGFGLLLLLDPTRPYGKNLCRCKLKSCRRFFLAIKKTTGRPRRQYCSEEHLDAARRETNLERVRRSRARKKAGTRPSQNDRFSRRRQ